MDASRGTTVEAVEVAGGTDGASRWVVFAIASIALFMASLDGTIVATGLPTLRQELHAPLNWIAWTMTGYQLGLVVVMPVAGRIADQMGRRRVFVAAAALFTTSSLLCGLAGNVEELIALRALQAAGGAAFMPAASGIVVEMFGRDRNRALGMFSSIFPLGALVGPIVGGVILADWSWRGLFLVNVPIGAAFTLLALRYLPESDRRPGRTDFVGALLLGGTILGIMASITEMGNRGAGLGSPSVAAPLVLAGACGWVFLRRCGRVEAPVVPLYLLRGRAFAACNVMNLVWGACAIGFGALVPLFAEDRYGLSPLAAGSLLTARAVSELVLATLASLLINRTGFRLPMVGGFLLVAGGLVTIVAPPVGTGPYLWMAAGAMLTGVGIGMSAPAANNASIELAPDDVGALTGLRGAARQGGAIIGVAAVTALASHTTNEAASMTGAFAVLALLLVATVPLVLLVPNGRGAATRSPLGPPAGRARLGA